LDKRITGQCYNMAAQAKRLGVRITTFMIAQDPYLQRFVHKFTETNAGRAYYSSLNGLGEYILEDFVRNRTRRVR
jgi:Ca-activated chloride channel homolog